MPMLYLASTQAMSAVQHRAPSQVSCRVCTFQLANRSGIFLFIIDILWCCAAVTVGIQTSHLISDSYFDWKPMMIFECSRLAKLCNSVSVAHKMIHSE